MEQLIRRESSGTEQNCLINNLIYTIYIYLANHLKNNSLNYFINMKPFIKDYNTRMDKPKETYRNLNDFIVKTRKLLTQ